MTRFTLTLVLIVTAALTGCADPLTHDGSTLSMDRNELYSGQSVVHQDDNALLRPIELEQNSIVVDGDAIDVGVFDDTCRIHMLWLDAEWVDTDAICSTTDGHTLVVEQAKIYLSQGVYSLVLRGTYDGAPALYSTIMGEPQYL